MVGTEVEWLAARARFVPPVGGFVSGELLEPAPYVEAPAPPPAAEWGSVEEADPVEAADPGEATDPGGAVEPDEETEPESLTVVGAAAVDPWEQDGADATPEGEQQGFFRRRRR